MSIVSIDLSVVIPVYNAEKSLYELHSRISSALEGRLSYEVIYVNDASLDNSLKVLGKIKKQNKNVRILNRKKNKGQHEAVILGLKYASGSMIANIDDDLQHDPAFIYMLSEILKSENLDIVYAVPAQSTELGSKIRDALFDLLFEKESRIRVSSFRVYTRRLGLSVLNNLKPFNYFSALVFQNPVRARSVQLPFYKRRHGRSNYSVLKRLVIIIKIIIYYGNGSYYGNLINIRRFKLSNKRV